MIRLIDANELHDAIGNRHMFSGESVGGYIREAPTVAAIPVEWLREKMQRPQVTCDNPFGFVLAEWLEEQEGE